MSYSLRGMRWQKAADGIYYRRPIHTLEGLRQGTAQFNRIVKIAPYHREPAKLPLNFVPISERPDSREPSPIERILQTGCTCPIRPPSECPLHGRSPGSGACILALGAGAL